MIFNGTKTMYSDRLKNYMSLGLHYEPLINTTLNETFVIKPRYDFNDDNIHYPKINVLVIGSDNNEPNKEINKFNLRTSPHSPLDASLFNHIPFYLRKVSEVDMYPPSDRYVLRKNITINEELYLACYGYRMDDIVYKGDIVSFNSIDKDYVNITKIDTNDGRYLNPTPRERIELYKAPDYYLGTFFKLFFFFNKDELGEMLNSFKTLYPTNPINRITEMGICSSIYLEDDNEVVWCGIEYFIDTDYNIQDAYDKSYLEFYVEVGNSEVIRG